MSQFAIAIRSFLHGQIDAWSGYYRGAPMGDNVEAYDRGYERGQRGTFYRVASRRLSAHGKPLIGKRPMWQAR